MGQKAPKGLQMQKRPSAGALLKRLQEAEALVGEAHEMNVKLLAQNATMQKTIKLLQFKLEQLTNTITVQA